MATELFGYALSRNNLRFEVYYCFESVIFHFVVRHFIFSFRKANDEFISENYEAAVKVNTGILASS